MLISSAMVWSKVSNQKQNASWYCICGDEYPRSKLTRLPTNTFQTHQPGVAQRQGGIHDSPLHDFGLHCCCSCRLSVLGLLPFFLLRLPCEFPRLGDSQHRLERLNADILRFRFVR